MPMGSTMQAIGMRLFRNGVEGGNNACCGLVIFDVLFFFIVVIFVCRFWATDVPWYRFKLK